MIGIKYKPKWRVSQQRTGLEILRGYLAGLSAAESPLLHNERIDQLLTVNLSKLLGRALKEYEDTLDATICTYTAYCFWRWLGDVL